MGNEVKKVAYLAGPMRNVAEFNFPRFNAVAAFLRADGFFIFNPAERDIERHGGKDISKGNVEGSLEQVKAEHGFSIRDAFLDDCNFILQQANAIVMLPGWEQSAGAKIEHSIAVMLKAAGEQMQIIYLSEDICSAIDEAYLMQSTLVAAE